MSTIGQTAFTLNDWKTRMNLDGTVADIVEVLAQSNPIMDHVLWKQGNLLTGNRVTQRSSIMEPGTRRINEGAKIIKSGTKQNTDTVVHFEAFSQLDEQAYDIAPDGDALRMSEDKAAIEGFGNKFARTLIYGDPAAATDEFAGLATRMAKIGSDNPTDVGYTVVSAGGSSANAQTSAYFVEWGDVQTYGIFPRNGKAGLDMDDKGLEKMTDKQGNIYYAYLTQFTWDVGLTVADPRTAGALRNIEPNALISGTAAQKLAFWSNLLTVHDRMRHPEKCKLYVGAALFTALKVFLSDKNNSYVTYDTLANGIKQLYVDGIPVFRLDAIRNDEPVIV